VREILKQRSTPYLWEHSWLSLYEERPKRKEIASFLFDPEISHQEFRRLSSACWKENQSNGKDHRGNGASSRKLMHRLKWLGHARLWGYSQRLTSEFGLADEYRFPIYEKFLKSEGLFSYSSLAKLKDAIRKSSLITGNLLMAIAL
jgi:hypothetical protein